MTDLYYGRNVKIRVTDPANNEILEVDDTRVIFEVQQTIDPFPNIGTIKIYNPSSDFSNFANRENMKLDILISYFEDKYKVLFLGDIKRAYSLNTNIDNIFVIEVGDSEKAITTSFLNKSYTNGIKKKTIVSDCIKILGIDVLSNTLNRVTGTYNGGFVSFNKVIDVLDIIINSLNLEYSIQNNQMVITEKGEIDSNNFIIIDYENGLLKKPMRLQDGGFLLNCLLEPKYSVQKTIFLNVPDLEGYFQIRNIDFIGDNEKHKWEVNLICQ